MKKPKPIDTLSAGDLRWLSAEISAIRRELDVRQGLIGRVQRALEALLAKLAMLEARIILLEAPAKSAPAQSSPLSIKQLMSDAAPHLWRIGLAALFIGIYRASFGSWPQQDWWVGLLRPH